MLKLDLKKDLRYLYAPSAKEVSVVEVPRFNFVMADGEIEPAMRPGTSPSFKEAMSALYGVSYTLKFMSKRRAENPIDYPVMALEGLWWTETGEYDIANPEGWKYTVMILQPEHITSEMYEETLRQLRKKRPDLNLRRLRFESFEEGLCMQIMHIGPYLKEPETLARMDAFARANGYRVRGKHHEIYLDDPMRSAEEKLKTILRHPIEKI